MLPSVECRVSLDWTPRTDSVFGSPPVRCTEYRLIGFLKKGGYLLSKMIFCCCCCCCEIHDGHISCVVPPIGASWITLLCSGKTRQTRPVFPEDQCSMPHSVGSV